MHVVLQHSSSANVRAETASTTIILQPGMERLAAMDIELAQPTSSSVETGMRPRALRDSY